MNVISKQNKCMEFVQMYKAIGIMDDNCLFVDIGICNEELKMELLERLIEYMETDLCPYLRKMDEEIGTLIANSKGHACNMWKEGGENEDT